MKKFFLALAVVTASLMSACNSSADKAVVASDSDSVNVDTVKVDSVKADSAKADSAVKADSTVADTVKK